MKRYRHPALEASISKKRLSQEARCILRARKNGVAAPCIYHIDYEAARIYMSFVVGQTLKAWLVALPADSELDAMLKAVGQSIAGLHDADVVHGDLTSSNIMVRLGWARGGACPRVRVLCCGRRPSLSACVLMCECARFGLCGSRSTLQTMTRSGMVCMIMMHGHAPAQIGIAQRGAPAHGSAERGVV